MPAAGEHAFVVAYQARTTGSRGHRAVTFVTDGVESAIRQARIRG